MPIRNLISVPQAIKEIRELIKCEWCDEMARGLAESDSDETLPSCGRQDHGTDFQSGTDNTFFQTRDRLLQIAERCYRAEQTLSEITTIAHKCEDSYKKVRESFSNTHDLQLHTYARELWNAVIDADYEPAE